MIKNYKELVDILQSSKHFCKLPIHVKIQQLCIRKNDDKFDWNHPQCVKVVMIQYAHHLRKTTQKALRKTFNITKPKDVENRPNDTNAKCVPWYSDHNNPDPSKLKLATAMTTKRKHKD